jgi:hypothetical protein
MTRGDGETAHVEMAMLVRHRPLQTSVYCDPKISTHTSRFRHVPTLSCNDAVPTKPMPAIFSLLD